MLNALALLVLAGARTPAQDALNSYSQTLFSALGITASGTSNVIGGGRESISVELSKPDRFRIEGDTEIVVGDGKTITRYFKRQKLYLTTIQSPAALTEIFERDSNACWRPFFDAKVFSGLATKPLGTANRQGVPVKMIEVSLDAKAKLTLSIGAQDNLVRQCAVDREDAVAKSTTILNISAITAGPVGDARFAFTPPAEARATTDEELRFFDKVRGGPVPEGTSQIEVHLSGLPMTVYTYRPASYRKGLIMLVIHGKTRNAKGYRDYILPVADKTGALVVAPEFDEKRWPESYLNGDVEGPDGSFRPQERWTYTRMAELVYLVRKTEGKLDIPFYMIGHSGGGQFINRLIAITDIGAVRYVAANPGAYCFPDPTVPYSHGLGKPLPSSFASEANIRRILAMPLTVLIGTSDLGREDLPEGRYDMAQGANRYVRAQNYYKFGKALASKLGCTFNWTYLEVAGIGHNAKPMFQSPQTYAALFGEKGMP